ncbi:MAG: MFS transporter [Candidatus Lokiarchaeota archaeon]|nr:MFS transporter [Candidatus Lokiarchaeota archaeon]
MSPKKTLNINEIKLTKIFWPVYLLAGFQSLAFSGIFVLTVPLSRIMWPDEPYRALEMGILVTTLFWTSSIAGLLIGRYIDKYSRTFILFIISIFRGFSMVMISFANEGGGIRTWWYFFLFIFIFACFAGGSYPAIVSLSHDIVPKKQRSQFFGRFFIIMSIFTMLGFLVGGLLFQIGQWRLFFVVIGVAITITGFITLIHIKEPKRGSQNEELISVLQDENIKYDFKINRETRRKTMLSKTNLVALIEGIFTNVFIGSIHILILPYIQNPPHNFSPFSTGVFLVVFGLTGGVIGQIVLAKVSDRVAEKNHIRRLYFIIFSLAAGGFTFILMFYLPLPHLTIAEGENLTNFFRSPVIWMMGMIYFTSSTISTLYAINQPPILQDINLPEAQGQIVSWNQFLENIGYGAGPLIAGLLITLSGQNYQLIAVIIGLIAIPGIILWICSIRWYPSDLKIVKEILEERANILQNRKNDSTPEFDE